MSHERLQEVHDQAQEMLARFLTVRMAHRKNYQRREALLASLETDANLLTGKILDSKKVKRSIRQAWWRQNK